MYRDVAQWTSIRNRILRKGISIRQAARETGISRNTVRKMVKHRLPPPFHPRSRNYPKLGPHTSSVRRLLDENVTLPPTTRLSIKDIYRRIRDTEGFTGSYGAVKDYARKTKRDRNDICVWEYAYELLISLDKKRAIDFLFLLSWQDPPVISESRTKQIFREARRVISAAPKPSKREQMRRAAFEWMRAVLQKQISQDVLREEIGDVPNLAVLLAHLYNERLSDRNRSMAILAHHRGLSSGDVCGFLSIDAGTLRKYVKTFEDGGHTALFARQIKSNRKVDNEALKQVVFKLLHEPPSNYDINRTTWIMPELCRVLQEKGHPACPEVVRTITKNAGYRWRKARTKLTSSDPDYREKIQYIQAILSNLRPDQAFFSIDEYGPFSVKMNPGRMLVPPGTYPTVPQWQKSKGCLIMTAALELASNQVTHFYSAAKNTAEMLRMMDQLIEQYCDRSQLFLSWDAASWHISKGLQQHIDTHNADAGKNSLPLVAIAPLPASSQFLNVIESVFSGMARAIIHNSNYPSVEDAKAAIDRYFTERNLHFQRNPKRAGNKIWGNERELPIFSSANNCKDPRYR